MPRTSNVLSRRWAFLVNSVAASPMVSFDARKNLYRACGMDIALDAFEVGARCYFHSSNLRIGGGTRINDNCFFENTARLDIGNGVGIGVDTAIITSHHDLGDSRSRSRGGWHYLPVTLEDGCWIGARSTVLAGVTIGAGCVVAAGAVVTADCEPNGLYGGVPARRLRDLDQAGAAHPVGSRPVRATAQDAG